MKHHRMKTERNIRFSTIAVTLLMIAALIGCFAVSASAATAAVRVDVGTNLDFSESNVSLTGGVYSKEYDGTNAVTGIKVTNAALAGVSEADAGKVALEVTRAYFNAVNAGEASELVIELALTGEAAGSYTVNAIKLPAQIRPKTLVWSGVATATATYRQDNVYNLLKVENLPKLTDAAGNAITGLTVSTPDAYTVSTQASKVGTYREQIKVVCAAADGVTLSNYDIPPMPVDVTVAPLVLTVAGDNAENAYSFEYGSADANNISIFGYAANGDEYPLLVVYPANYGSVGTHTISVAPANENFTVQGVTTYTVTINPKVIKVAMDNALFVKNEGGIYSLTVKALEGEMPAEVLAAITYGYTLNGEAVAAVDAYGAYTVVATLPTSNYAFQDTNGESITTLTATLTLNRAYLAVGTESAPYLIYLTAENGVDVGLQATLTIPDPATLDRKAFRGFRLHKEYTLNVSNSVGTYTVLIPIDTSLYHENCAPFTAENLYMYDAATGTMVKVAESTGFKVSVADGYFKIEGVTGDASRTFVVAPDYRTPFWISAPGIALLILLVLALIVLMFFIGVYHRRVQSEVRRALAEQAEKEANAEVADDATETENAPEEAEGEEETVEEEQTEMPEVDVDEVIEQMTEKIVEDLKSAEEGSAAEESADADAVDAVVTETLAETAQEGENTANETDADESVEAFAEIAEDVAEDVEETAEEVEEPVADVATVVSASEASDTDAKDDDDESDEDGDDENEDDEDDERSASEQKKNKKSDSIERTSFGILPAKAFVDVNADPEAYQALLERERNGEIRIVTRYRKSFLSRMAKSQGSVQDYYSELKNALLSYKGVNCRSSWSFESFNRGRTHLAKMCAKTKTLYLYLALDPAELKGSKYGIEDVSAKKKYAKVPVLIKIKGERKFKYALELIEKLCTEKLALPKTKREAVDYRIPCHSDEELVKAGIMKKMVAGVPLTKEPTDTAAATEQTTETTEA